MLAHVIAQKPIVPHLLLLMTDHDRDDARNTPTISAPPPSAPSDEVVTSVSSERPAIAPPARLPETDDLSTSQLASKTPPAWWPESFMAKVASDMADDARAIREGRDRQHAEQMKAIKAIDSKFSRFGERITRVENDIRTLSRKVDGIQRDQHDQRDEYAREVREVKSLLTAAFFRMEMLESNGHDDDEQPLAGKNVLVVEDEIMLQRTMRRMLEKRGADVVTAANWAEVTNAIESETVIDFVVLDIRLEAEDGIQIAEWLKAKEALGEERILLMTGHLDVDHDELARELGLRVLEKPFTGADLVRAIRESLDVAASATEAPPG